jgi:hypothetical protein
MSLETCPIRLEEAKAFVRKVHRHSPNPGAGWLFGIGACADGELVGVAIVGRPVSGALDDGVTVEINRVATNGHRNACSFLYGAAWRAARAMGYQRAVTYTLQSEAGGSLRAAGWRITGEVKPRRVGWANRPGRRQQDPLPKFRWEPATTQEGDRG